MSNQQALVAGICLFFLVPMPACTQPVRIKFIETSDVHGSIFPYDFIANAKVPESLAQVYTYVKEQRRDLNQHVILMDNGDILQGQPLVYYYNFEKPEGAHICSQVMNFMKYDVGVVGNHDIEPGHAVYDKVAREFDFPWLAANVVKKDTGMPYFGTYIVLNRGGVKIAILGLTTPGIPGWIPENLWKGMEFLDMIELARKWVKVIEEKENPDLLIGLFHAGVDYTYKGQTADQKLNENASELIARRVLGFDVVFVGHDHEGWNKIVVNDAGKEVLILGTMAGAKTISVAEVEMTRDGDSWKKKIIGKTLETANYSVDGELMKKFKGSVEEVKDFVSRPIGKFAKTVCSRDSMFGDSAFVGLVHEIQLDLTGADISFAAPLSFDTCIREGNLYVCDAFKLYKYENMLYTMRMSGQEIKDYLEYSYGKWFAQMKNQDDHLILFKYDEDGKMIWFKQDKCYQTNARYYNYDSAAGIIYTVDVSKPVGQRISIESMADKSPFYLDKIYKVAVNSFRGNGGGGHFEKGAGIAKSELSSRIFASSDHDLRFLLMKWIEKHRDVTPKAQGNWKIVPAAWCIRGREKDYRLLYESNPPEDAR